MTAVPNELSLGFTRKTLIECSAFPQSGTGLRERHAGCDKTCRNRSGVRLQIACRTIPDHSCQVAPEDTRNRKNLAISQESGTRKPTLTPSASSVWPVFAGTSPSADPRSPPSSPDRSSAVALPGWVRYRGLSRASRYSHRRKISDPFVPPNPNEFDSAMCREPFWGVFGT